MIDWNNLILLAIAVLNAFVAYLTWQTKLSAARAEENIKKVEIATNSMKDALVKSTRTEADAAGFERGRKSEEDKTAIFEEGRRAGIEQNVIAGDTAPVEIVASVPLEIKEKP